MTRINYDGSQGIALNIGPFKDQQRIEALHLKRKGIFP